MLECQFDCCVKMCQSKACHKKCVKPPYKESVRCMNTVKEHFNLI